jgi:archaellum component FlaC
MTPPTQQIVDRLRELDIDFGMRIAGIAADRIEQLEKEIERLEKELETANTLLSVSTEDW